MMPAQTLFGHGNTAATVHIVSPSPGACTKVPQLSASTTSHNVLVQFSSSDVLPSAACNDFAKAIFNGGLTLDYTAVPYWNGKTAATVRVTLTK